MTKMRAHRRPPMVIDIDAIIQEQAQKQQEKRDSLVFLNELAVSLNTDHSNLRKYIKKRGFDVIKFRNPDANNQIANALTKEDAKALIEMRFEEGHSL